MSKLYNEEFKEKYLNERFDNEDSQRTVRNIFSRAELIEDILGKDLYDFNISEIAKAIQNMNPYSTSVAKNYVRAVSKYISWCIEPVGIREDNINPLRGIDLDEFVEDLVDKSKKIHFSYDEMVDIVEELYNAQDQALVWLLFEGVQGKSFSEIRSLNYNTINWDTNELIVKDEEGSTRTVKVSDRCMRYVENAYREETYRSAKENARELLRSDFVIRNVKSPRSKSEDIGIQALYSRLYKIKDDAQLDYLTANGIKQSGMIYMSAELVKEKIARGEKAILRYEDMEKIGEKFNTPKIKTEKHEYYNTYLLYQFITPKTIKELYNLDVEIMKK